MKIKVMIGDTEKEVVLRAFEHHAEKFMVEYSGFQEVFEKEGESLELVQKFKKFKNDMLFECLNITHEEFERIDLEDKNKLKSALQEMLFPEADKEKIFF